MRRQALLLSSVLTILLAIPTSAVAQSTEDVPGAEERFHQHEAGKVRPEPSVGALRQPAIAAAAAVRRNFRLVGHIALPADEVHADVALFDYGAGTGVHAFVGSWSGRCAGTGVKIIDASRPANPKLVSIAGSHPGESHEDVDVLRIGNRIVMGTGVQVCGESGQGRAGLLLMDVTNPSDPKNLSFFPTPAGGVHELDLVARPDGKVLALLAVPFVEFENTYFGADAGGEFRIVDITRPRNPVELSNWGVIANSSLPIPAGNDEYSSSFQGLGHFAAAYAHSARAADEGMTAYVSYWDAGILKFDISDPTDPQLVARTTYPLPADGDGHSMTTYDVRGHRYIFQNDEDEDPFAMPTITSTATGDKRFYGIEEPWAPTILTQTGTVRGRVHDAGDGCQASDYAGARDKVALADSIDPFYVDIIPDWPAPPCTIGRQVVLAARAGAIAFVSNLVSPDDAYVYFEGPANVVQEVAVGMPVVQISDIDELAVRIRRALRQGPVRIRLNPSRPTHGFIRVFREDRGTDRDGDGVVELRQVGKFAGLPYVSGPDAFEAPPGSWEVHNTEVTDRRAYSSWYSHGIVALAIGDPTEPKLVGQFVPPASGRFGDIFGPAFPLVWGVAIDEDSGLIYASDMRSGLWIVKPTGRAAPH
jgi:hypothetical protein